jgi:hypothetical protein
MTRREIWNQIGVSAAVWFMLFSLVRVWWRIYLVWRQSLMGFNTARAAEPSRRRRLHWRIGNGET